jgi:hypothetical protein
MDDRFPVAKRIAVLQNKYKNFREELTALLSLHEPFI